MKKIVLSVFALCTFGFISAQDITTNAGTFTKPKAGDILGEVNFSPNINGGTLFTMPDAGLDGMMGIKARKFITDTKAYRAIANFQYKDTGVSGSEAAYGLVAGFGIEHHLTGAERLSTYWGYEGKLMFSKDELKTTKFGIGAGVVAGFDYYIVPNVYLGVEAAYGLTVLNVKPDAGDGATAIELRPSLNPSFRLGWRF